MKSKNSAGETFIKKGAVSYLMRCWIVTMVKNAEVSNVLGVFFKDFGTTAEF